MYWGDQKVSKRNFDLRWEGNLLIGRFNSYRAEIKPEDDSVSWKIKLKGKVILHGKLFGESARSKINRAITSVIKSINKWRKENKETAFIYALINPFNKKCFYLGSTKNDLKIRLSQHISTRGRYIGNPEKNKIIRRIIDKGKRPIIVEICKCLESNRFRKEIFYFKNTHLVEKKLKKLGYA